MVYNGLINIASIEYLKYCELVLISLTNPETESSFMGGLIIYGITCLLIGYLFLTSYVLYFKSNDVLMKSRLKYGNLYANVKLNS